MGATIRRRDLFAAPPAANLPKTVSVQVDGGEPVLSALYKLDEPPSLVALRKAVDARMPRVDVPELPLEMHARTGFAAGFTQNRIEGRQLPRPWRSLDGRHGGRREDFD